MNDDLMTRLDERGHAAGAAAQAAVAEHPIPDFDPDLVRVSLDDEPLRRATGSGPGGRDGRRWLAVVGIAAALLVVALGAALASRTGDDDSAPAERVGTTDPARPFVAGWLPEGLQVSAVADGSGSPSVTPTSDTVVYGPSIDEPRVAIVVVDGGSVADQVAEQEGEEYLRSIGTSAGREVYTVGGERTFTFDVDDLQIVLLAADGVDESTVLAVAGSVQVDGMDPTLAEVPEGWERLGTLDDAYSSVGVTGSTAVSGHHVAYTGAMREDANGASMPFAVVSSSTGTPLDLAVVRFFTDGAEDVVVHGHPAVLAWSEDEAVEGEDASREWMVAWEERPGEIVRVASAGVSRDDVLAIAQDVRAVSAAEWDELARTAVLTPSEGQEVVGVGEFSDGSTWALMAPTGESEPMAYLKTSVTGGDYSSSGSGIGQAIGPDGEPVDSERPVLPDVSREGGEAFGWAYGLLDPTSGAAVTRVAVVDASGAVVAEAVLVGEGDLRGWVVELPPGLLPSDDSSGSSSSESSSGSSESSSDSPTTTESSEGVATTAGSGDVEETGDGFAVVAYAADGTELGRQPLP